MRFLGALALCVSLGCSSTNVTIDAGADVLPPVPSLSDSVSISNVVVYQAVKAMVVEDGVHVDAPAVPVIAGRPAMVRVFPSLADGFSKTLEGELHLMENGEEKAVLRDKKKLVVPADDSSYATSFNFLVEADALGGDTSFFAVLKDPDHPGRAEAMVRYPTGDTMDTFGAVTDSAALKLQIVPIQYGADGSQRVPDTSPAGLKPFEDALYRMYPTAKISTTVHAPFPWTQKIAPNGAGWDELLMAMFQLRLGEGVRGDVYTVAMFNPAPTFAQYCSNGCIAGIGLGEGKTTPLARIAMIVGYDGEFMRGTLAQELAHSMGREHAPCGGPQGIDPKFPYKDGSIGKWGYDLMSRQLVSPYKFNDFMSYCSPVFVSDYTYAAVYRQMAYVTKTTPSKSVHPPVRYRAVHLSKSGARVGRTIALPEPVSSTRWVKLDGREPLDAPYFDLSEIGQSIVLLPETISPDVLASARIE